MNNYGPPNPPPEAYCPCCQRLSDCCICNHGGASYYGEQCGTCQPLSRTPEGRALKLAVQFVADHYERGGDGNCMSEGAYRYAILQEIQAAIAEEREACAVIADNWKADVGPALMEVMATCPEVSTAIRARSA